MNIVTGQVVFLIAVLAFGWYVVRLRTVLTDRLILVALTLAALVAIISPDTASWVAHRLGIGRGADMLIYFFIVFCLFRFVEIAADRRATQKSLTEVVRALAIQNAQQGQARKDGGMNNRGTQSSQ
ncbi:MAG TPA: DUF2304 domain-containing protein [Anaerolineaceae bacterium]|nr:DUF2304 domain-containing protein [Anaerolineaceae bacterium]